MVGVGELRFKNDTEWEMEMIDGLAVGRSDNPVWCQGTYYFEGNPGTSALHIVIDPNKGDPSNVKLAGDDNKLVDNGTEIVYQPDETGTYVVKINCIAGEVSAGGATVDQATMKFQFKPPQDGTPAGVAA